MSESNPLPGPTRRSFRSLASEAAMVVFAVLVALAVDAWWEDRQNHELAERVRASVEAEIRANLADLESTAEDLASKRSALADALADVRAGRPASLDLDFEIPDVSTAAWRAAQVTQAAPYLDYAWVIEVSRAYQSQSLYDDVQRQLIATLARPPGEDGGEAWISALAGQVSVLMQLQEELEAAYRELLEPDSAVSRQGP